jgi:hypothetical protein
VRLIYLSIKPIVLVLTCLIFLLSLPPAKAQEFTAQRTKFTLYNVGFNGLAAGIGAVINKEEDQRWQQAFWKGLGQGALGGLLMHGGKALTYQIYKHENLGYAWPAHLVHAAGASITQNAASNRNFWEQWHINLWLLRFDFEAKDRNFQARIFPSGLYGYLMLEAEGRLNLRRSLATGLLYFDYEDYIIYDGSSQATSIIVGLDESIYGRAEYYSLAAHEVAHSLQYEGFVFLNPLLKKPDQQWKEQHEWYRKLSRFVYFDLNGLYFLGAYHLLEGGFDNPCYWQNFFEKEAEHYSHRRFVDCP